MALGHNGLNFLNVQNHVARAANLEQGCAMEANVQEIQLKHNFVIVTNAKLVKIRVNIFSIQNITLFYKIAQL